jgi:hypothetical protein
MLKTSQTVNVIRMHRTHLARINTGTTERCEQHLVINQPTGRDLETNILCPKTSRIKYGEELT